MRDMRRLVAFENVTLDGYFTGPDGSIEWAHAGASDSEWSAFVTENASGGGQLLLGRKTYEVMASYWPTPAASQNMPVVAKGMNEMPKVVFSRTMRTASWSNTTVERGDLPETVRRMKNEAGPGITILGSGSIVAQLTRESLIDEYQLVVNPVVLGRGRTLFDGITAPLTLELTRRRGFRNGKTLLSYHPAR
jgi:dihydrofolate reductase